MLRLHLILCTLLLCTTTALATELPAELTRDLAPVNGTVILALPDQTLIDRDANAGVREGDLFAVLAKGEAIVHPTTGAVLGQRQSVEGWLRAARIRSGYTEMTRLDPRTPVAVGDQIGRFNDAEAVLIDPTGDGAALFDALQAALPQLRWLGYFRDETALPPAGATPRLFFTLSATALDVREMRTGLLRHYPLVRPAAVTTTPPSSGPVAAAATVDAWNGPSWSGVPVALEVVDLDRDGKQEVIVATAHTLEVGRFQGRTYQKLYTKDLGLSRNLIGLDAADLDRDGNVELWVTAARGMNLDSLALNWDGKQLREVADHVNWWLRNLELPGEGRVLLAQGIGANDFDGAIFRVAYDGSSVSAGAPVDFPAGTRLYGLARLAAPDGLLTVRLTSEDKLQVLAASGETLQESDEVYGGSERFIPRPDPRLAGVDADSRNAFAPPRLETVASRYLLAPANLGSRLLVRQRVFSKARLDLLQWDGLTLRPVRTGRVEPGYLADFRHADLDNDGRDETILLLALSRPGVLGKGRYGLVVYESYVPKD